MLPLLIALLTGSALGIPAAPRLEHEIQQWETRGSELCWPSGLRVVAVAREGTPLATVTAVLDGGDAAEAPDAKGAAHLVEHLWFRSATPDGASVRDASAGLALHAETFVDSTVYSTVGPAEDLPALLQREARRLADPLRGVTPAILDEEKAVLARELAYRGEHAERVALNHVVRELYPDAHPYGGGLETTATVEALTLDRLEAYTAASYRPAHLTLRLEGDVPTTRDALATLVSGAFPPDMLRGDRTACTHPPSSRVPAGVPDATLARIPAAIEGQRLYFGWSLPPGYGPGQTAMRLAVQLVEGAVSKRLFHVSGLNIPGVAEYHVACTFRPGARSSAGLCATHLPTDVDLGEVLDAVRAATSVPWRINDSDQMQRRLDLAILSRTEFTQTLARWDSLDAGALAHRARWMHHAVSADARAELESTYRTTESDILELGREYLTAERMASVALVPGDIEFTEHKAAAIDPVLTASGPVRWSRVEPDLSRVHATSLDRNGLDVWVVSQGRTAPSLARAAVVSTGGWATEPVAGVHEALDAVMTHRFSVSPWKILHQTATTGTTRVGSRQCGAETAGSAALLDLQAWMLRVYADTLPAQFHMKGRQTAIDYSIDTWFRTEELAAIAVGQDPWMLAGDHRRAWLLPGDPAGTTLLDRLDAARYVRQGAIRHWHRTVKHPENSAVIVAGPVDPDQAVASVRKYLGRWRSGKRLPLPAPVLPALPERDIALFRKAKPLTSVTLACRLPGRTAERAPAHDVLSALLSTSLRRTFRDAGIAYTPEAWIEPARDDVALLHVALEVPPGRGADAVHATQALLAEVAQGPPELLVDEARHTAGLRFARSLADTAGSVGLVRDHHLAGGTPSELRTHLTRVHQVQPTDLADLLATCIDHEAITLVGGERLDDLHEAGLTEAREVDWHAQMATIVEQLK